MRLTHRTVLILQPFMAIKISGLLIILLIPLMALSCSPNESPSVRSRAEIARETDENKREIQDGEAGLTEKEVKETETARKGNSPPQITRVKIMPEVFKPGDTLYIEAEANDPDGDEVTIFYEWHKNGELVSTEREIKSHVKRGDNLFIKLRPFDGKDYGKEVTLKRDILNVPPVIEDHRDYHFDGNLFTYQVKAYDPDGDDLKYSIKTGPVGMTIDSTGLIRWNVPPEYKDKTRIIVSVTDGHGGEALQAFNVEIAEKRD